MPRLSQEPSFDGRVAEYGQNAHCSIELEERKWTRRSLDFWERWRRSGHSMPRRPRRPLVRLQPTFCGRIPSPTFSSRSRTRLRCCRRSMNPRRPRRRTKTFSLPSTTTTTIIITTTTDMADIMGMMRRPASSSCLADTVITIITIITASIAATIEVARSDDDKTGPRGPVFLWTPRRRPRGKRGPITTGFSCCGKVVKHRFSIRTPRRMGPCFRRDDDDRAALSLESELFLAGLLFRRAMEMPIGAVEHGVGRGGPFGPGGQRRTAVIDAPRLQFALGRLFLVHLLKVEGGFLWDHDDLRERFVRPENMDAALGRRLEDAKEHHRPPVAYQRRHRDRHGVGTVGIEPRVRLGPDRPALFDLEIEHDLVGVKMVAKIPERRPLHAAVPRRSPISPPYSTAVLCADVQLVVVRIKQFDPVLRALPTRNAVPHLFA